MPVREHLRPESRTQAGNQRTSQPLEFKFGLLTGPESLGIVTETYRTIRDYAIADSL